MEDESGLLPAVRSSDEPPPAARDERFRQLNNEWQWDHDARPTAWWLKALAVASALFAAWSCWTLYSAATAPAAPAASFEPAGAVSPPADCPWTPGKGCGPHVDLRGHSSSVS